MLKVKTMTKGQINHTFCTWCDYRVAVGSSDYWGCSLKGDKLDELCSYKKALLKEEKQCK
ncbi:hypothetical protein [Desulfolucanica intricata]|uniref:hypothetical protein n=1 Tax=Desulfolucanica intricata TaxID=1285191 RepID=UPI0008330A6F|nr:hypothetical protein [Desulfolucanica intricata]